VVRKVFFRLALLGIAVLVNGGCASPDIAEQAQPEGAERMAVFYGTDRNRRDSNDPEKFYGYERGVFEYGVVEVSGAADDYKTRLESVTPRPRQAFLADLQAAVRNAPEPSALVFVHGYLRSFRQISELVAEFAEDTGFAGVPLFWSWPSTTNPAGYTVDETSIKWSQPHFAQFLQDVLEHSGATRVHLVGHSLGGRSLSRTIVQDLLPAGVNLSVVGELVLLAPDIDQEIFTRDLAPVLLDAGLSVSLYTSANDKAMASAYMVHGGRRAGDSSGGGPVTLASMETIDVTAANRSILGHSYFEESEMVTEDLAELLSGSVRASQRDQLELVEEGGKTYWRLLVDH
jgi:esterase/lipase superfamily enzyme